MTHEELFALIEQDHAKWCGKKVKVREAGVSNDNDDANVWRFKPPIEVLVTSQPYSHQLDSTEHRSDGGLIDTHYPAENDQDSRLKDHEDGPYHIWWIDGPTYYFDGRIEYPQWWPKEERKS